MSRIYLVGDPMFTTKSIYLMYNYKAFQPQGCIQGPKVATMWLENWFQVLKTISSRWRVPQPIYQSLPPITHIQLELDFTKFWFMQCATDNAKDLDYYPQIKEIFQDPIVQSTMTYPIPNISWRKDLHLEYPLTDGDMEEAFEASLYIEIFGFQDEEENPLALVMSKT